MKQLALVVLTLGILVTGCGMVKGKEEAEAVAKAYMDHRIQNGGFGLREHYSGLFFKKAKPGEWEMVQALVDKSMGRLESYELKNWNVNSNAATGSDMNGTIVKLVYETAYEKGKGVDTITLHRPLNGSEFKIAGAHFNSERIQQTINEGIAKVVEEKDEVVDTGGSDMSPSNSTETDTAR